jgi:hypothetical protein
MAVKSSCRLHYSPSKKLGEKWMPRKGEERSEFISKEIESNIFK